MSLPIRIEVAPPIAELILDRPGKRNALSAAMWEAIPQLVAAAVADPAVKVLILHGGGAGAFAAGADISEFETIYATPESAAKSGAAIAAALAALEACPKPVIAAIRGACIGGGVSLAMTADLRVAGYGSTFGVTPGKLGLVYAAGDSRRLIAAVGIGAAKDILFTGRIFSASEAKDMRLVDRLCPDEDALIIARKLAAEISSLSQWSVRATKAMIRGLQSGWSDEAPQAEALFLAGFSGQDFGEGYRAFLEKRPARFTHS